MPISRPLKTRALILGLIWAAASLAWGSGGGVLNDPTATFAKLLRLDWLRTDPVRGNLRTVYGVEAVGARPTAPGQ